MLGLLLAFDDYRGGDDECRNLGDNVSEEVYRMCTGTDYSFLWIGIAILGAIILIGCIGTWLEGR